MTQPQWQPNIDTPQQGGIDHRQRLAMAVQGAVARGGRVESQSEFNAVIVYGHRVNHVLHLLITIFTFGLWGFVWLVLALAGGEKREMVTADSLGNVTVQRL